MKIVDYCFLLIFFYYYSLDGSQYSCRDLETVKNLPALNLKV